jgi:polyhydroxybutyrate depolymerase
MHRSPASSKQPCALRTQMAQPSSWISFQASSVRGRMARPSAWISLRTPMLIVLVSLGLWLGAPSAHADLSDACRAGSSPGHARPPFDHHTLSSETIVANGVQRDYKLAIPDNLDSAFPVALVFGWHSLAAQATDARAMLDLERYARGQAIFVYPEAIYAPERDMVRWDLTADKQSPALGSGNDIALFDAVLAELGRRFCIDKNEVFSAGFSAGAFMSNTLACYRPDRVRAIAAIAGKLEQPPDYAKTACSETPVAAFIAHGTSDGVVPLTAGQAARDHWLALAQCSSASHRVSPSPCRAYDGCSEGHPVIWCEHQEADRWGPHLVPRFAPKAMWNFFAQFIAPSPVPAPTVPVTRATRPPGG